MYIISESTHFTFMYLHTDLDIPKLSSFKILLLNLFHDKNLPESSNDQMINSFTPSKLFELFLSIFTNYNFYHITTKVTQ